jgi:gamma-glutamyltranspeptidase
MAMYVQLLSAVFMSEAAEAATPAELLALARRHRHQMLTSPGHAPTSAERDLAYDVNYDCALIGLCLAVGIPAAPACFGRPRDERARLERALIEAGVDLVGAGLDQLPSPL